MSSPQLVFPSLEEVIEQERTLVLASASPADLYALGRLAADTAIADGLALVIQIRLGERLVFHAGAPGSSPLNDEWATRKARTAHLFQKSSMRVQLSHQQDGVDFEAKHRLPMDRYSISGGCFPLSVAGTGFVGSMAVSGLPQTEDHAFIVRILGEHITGSAR
jgi:uncharacterized protein (UPF0303 family)